MSHISLRCTQCKSCHTADMATLHCSSCEATLEVVYSDSPSDTPLPQPPGWNGPAIPLPIHDTDASASMAEGNTPCVELPSLAGLMGLQHLYGKLEFLNPTGSFKDRGTAIMLSAAREHGVEEIVEDSSGNAGASVAAYSARAGLKAHIFAPATAPPAKIQQIMAYDATVHLIEGPREMTTEAAIAYRDKHGLTYASHNLSPYFIEGTKTFAYEVAEQLAGGVPDHIAMPVGNGSLFIGAWKGFRELLEAGRIAKMPRLHCIQATAVMPIAAAYNGTDWTPTEGVSTIAGGISVGAPPRVREVLNVLQDSGGVALAVQDDEILRWQRLLASVEGIYAEPTSAAAFAGLDNLVRRGEAKGSDSVLVPITGSGLKDAPPP